MIRRGTHEGDRGGFRRRGHTHIFGRSCCTADKYNIVKQLYWIRSIYQLEFWLLPGLKYLFLHSLPSNMLLILLYAAEIPFFSWILWHLIWIKYCFLNCYSTLLVAISSSFISLYNKCIHAWVCLSSQTALILFIFLTSTVAITHDLNIETEFHRRQTLVRVCIPEFWSQLCHFTSCGSGPYLTFLYLYFCIWKN